MARFLLITTRTSNFNPDVLPAHFAYLNELRGAGKLELSGGFTDATGGAYLIQVESMAEAEAIAHGDPLISSGASTIAVKHKQWLAK